MSAKAGKKLNLSALLTSEVMAPVLSHPVVKKKLKAALPAAVPVDAAIYCIKKALVSPRFRQALVKLVDHQGQLQALMAQFGPKSSKGTDQEEVEELARAMQNDESRGVKVDLSAVLTPEVMAPILANPEVQAQLKSQLPAGMELPKTEEDMTAMLATPEFQQAMTLLSAATASEQLEDLMQQFGLPEEAIKAANTGDLEAFSKTLSGFSKPDKKAK